MAVATETFSDWLAQAQVPEGRLTPEQRGLLQAAFRFRQRQGSDYYSTRLLGHFLLHCSSGLKVAQLARLLRISRPTASRQQRLSSKEAIQQAHHRLDGRPYGKLLPHHAGPIAGFLFGHPNATRADLIDFIDRTFGIRVARVALYKFLKKYGLQDSPTPAPAPAAVRPVLGADQPAEVTPLGPALLPPPLPAAVPVVPQGQPIPTPAPPFSAPGRSTPAPSC
jgi:transposase